MEFRILIINITGIDDNYRKICEDHILSTSTSPELLGEAFKTLFFVYFLFQLQLLL